MADLTAQVNARLNSIESTMAQLGLGRSKVYELIATGELRSVKVGRRRLVSDAAINEFVTRLDLGGDAA